MVHKNKIFDDNYKIIVNTIKNSGRTGYGAKLLSKVLKRRHNININSYELAYQLRHENDICYINRHDNRTGSWVYKDYER